MQLSNSLVSLAITFAAFTGASPIVQRQDANATASAPELPTSSTASASSTSTASSAPAPSTSAAAGALNDTQILQFALTLEHLEAAFYNQSISKFGEELFAQAGLNATVRDQLYSVGLDEAAHVTFLETALGNQSVSPCTYDFSAVKDVPSFLATAQVLEGVGTSAYLGAAALIADKAYLEAAGSILTVEARHATYINAALAKSNVSSDANVVPAPFDTPLNATAVYSLAAPFIVSCPDNSTLPFTAFPTANVTLASAGNSSSSDGTSSTEASTVSLASSSSSSSRTRRSSASSSTATASSSAASPTSTGDSAASTALTPGALVQVSYDASALSGASQDGTNTTSGNATTYAAILTGVAAPVFVALDSDNTFTLPANITGGQSYVIVTSSNTSVTDDNTLAVGVAFISVPLPKAPAASVTYSAASSSTSGSSSGSASTTATSVSSPAGNSTDSGSGAGDVTPLVPTPTPTA